jgi:hypothetical protein
VSDESEILWNFVRFVLTPLRKASGTSRADVIRELKALLADIESPSKHGSQLVEKALTNSPHTSDDGIGGNQGTISVLEKWTHSVKQWSARQRSIAREMEILRLLEETNGAVVLKDIHERVIVLGLSEESGQGAVVTQISRLAKKGAIGREAQGVYKGTEEGSDRLKKMRLSYRNLVVPDEVRKNV